MFVTGGAEGGAASFGAGILELVERKESLRARTHDDVGGLGGRSSSSWTEWRGEVTIGVGSALSVKAWAESRDEAEGGGEGEG